MTRTCLFLSICALVLVGVAADWRLVHTKDSETQRHLNRPEYPHHHRPYPVHPGGLYPLRPPPHRTVYKIKTTTKAFETDEIRRQNEELKELRQDDQMKSAIIIGGSVGGAVIIILAIVVVALVLRNKRRRRAKVIEIESKPITNPRYQISIINPKLHGPPPSYDNIGFKKDNSGTPRYVADEYDVKMDDVKDFKFHLRADSLTKKSKNPKFEDLYNHLNATDVQNVHQNLYKRGDSTDESTGGDEADNELSDEVEVQGPSKVKDGKDNPGADDQQAGKF